MPPRPAHPLAFYLPISSMLRIGTKSTGQAMRTDFPKATEVDRSAYEKALKRPPAHTQYVIFFTPRAGSSWLTDVATQTGQLGRPSETFNPRHLNKIARSMNATNLREYCHMLARLRATKGVAGFEITHHQLRAVFRGDVRFRAFYPNPHVFWLIRKDIVGQAVSLYKMTTTRVSHSVKLGPDEIAVRDAAFEYSSDRIAHWINHILLAEHRTEALISAAGWRPMRLWYEENAQIGAQAMLGHMAAFMGLPALTTDPKQASGHTKIATGKNVEFAERFAEERPEFLRQVAQERAPYLEKLRPYEAQIGAPTGDAEAA